MRQIKKMLVVLTALALCIGSILATPITVKAAGDPVTYYLKYVTGEWRFQAGGWVEDGNHRELYYMHQDIKDGDMIVIDGDAEIELSVNVNLKNLTIVKSPAAVISAKSIDEFYALNGSVCAITGDVNRADVYDECIVNFNSNVKKLNVLSDGTDTLSSTVAGLGTVEHLYAGGASGKHFEFYSFAAGSLYIEKGVLKTDAAKYSTVPVAADTAQTTPSAGTSSDEYDEVPKTADARFNPLWLVGIAAVCLAGGYALKKEK